MSKSGQNSTRILRSNRLFLLLLAGGTLASLLVIGRAGFALLTEEPSSYSNRWPRLLLMGSGLLFLYSGMALNRLGRAPVLSGVLIVASLGVFGGTWLLR